MHHILPPFFFKSGMIINTVGGILIICVCYSIIDVIMESHSFVAKTGLKWNLSSMDIVKFSFILTYHIQFFFIGT